MMPPKKVRSVVMPKNKRTREVTPIHLQQGPPAKRTQSNASDTDIVMTIMQPIDANKLKKSSQKPNANPTCSRAKEARNSCSTASLAHPQPGCNTPAMLHPLWGSISLLSSSPCHPGGLGAHLNPQLHGTGTCGHQGLFSR